MRTRLSFLLVMTCVLAGCMVPRGAGFSTQPAIPVPIDALTSLLTPAPSLVRSPRPSLSPPEVTLLPLTGGKSPSPAVASQNPGGMSPNPTASHLGPNGRGFSEAGPWLAYYGQANDLGDLDAIAKTYRLFVIQATSFDALQIAKLQAGGRNRVLTYLDLGSVEHSASWWNDAPTGFLPAGQAKAAQIGPYGGYPDETWMNPANTDWRHLLVDYIAPKQLAAGADGFFFDNLELLEHGSVQTDGPCDAACASAGFDMVYALRQKFPQALFVMNNATSETVRTATLHGVTFPTLLDGVVHEGAFTEATPTTLASAAIYHVAPNAEILAQLDAWKSLDLQPGGHPFWMGTLDFVNACSNSTDARRVETLARARGYSPAISDKSAGLHVVCAVAP